MSAAQVGEMQYILLLTQYVTYVEVSKKEIISNNALDVF